MQIDRNRNSLLGKAAEPEKTETGRLPGERTAYRIRLADNTATALEALEPGPVCITGETDVTEIAAVESIPKGHKLAVRAIEPGEAVVKYGVPIGTATAHIAPGSWIHMHCMRSNYDERSSHLDLKTGVPEGEAYE